MSELHVWMNGAEVASWQEHTRTGPRLTYLPSWLASEQPRPLSLSLPLLPAGESHRGQVVTDYFDNLAVQALLPAGFPVHVATSIFAGLQQAGMRLAEIPEND